MLLDALNTPFTDQADGPPDAGLCKEQFKPADRMGVFTLTGSLNVLQDFTSDPQTCTRRCRASSRRRKRSAKGSNRHELDGGPGNGAIDGRKPRPSTPAAERQRLRKPRWRAARRKWRLCQPHGGAQGFRRCAGGYAKDQRAVVTLAALSSLARILGGLPGRKNLIWVAGDLCDFSFIPEDRDMLRKRSTKHRPASTRAGSGNMRREIPKRPSAPRMRRSPRGRRPTGERASGRISS